MFVIGPNNDPDSVVVLVLVVVSFVVDVPEVAAVVVNTPAGGAVEKKLPTR